MAIYRLKRTYLDPVTLTLKAEWVKIKNMYRKVDPSSYPNLLDSDFTDTSRHWRPHAAAYRYTGSSWTRVFRGTDKFPFATTRPKIRLNSTTGVEAGSYGYEYIDNIFYGDEGVWVNGPFTSETYRWLYNDTGIGTQIATGDTDLIFPKSSPTNAEWWAHANMISGMYIYFAVSKKNALSIDNSTATTGGFQVISYAPSYSAHSLTAPSYAVGKPVTHSITLYNRWYDFTDIYNSNSKIQWFNVNPSVTPSATPIASQTLYFGSITSSTDSDPGGRLTIQSTYTPDANDVGKYLYVKVTLANSNTKFFGTPVSVPVLTSQYKVQSTPVIDVQPSITTGYRTIGTTLTANTGKWTPDPDKVYWTWQWSSNGTTGWSPIYNSGGSVFSGTDTSEDQNHSITIPQTIYDSSGTATNSAGKYLRLIVSAALETAYTDNYTTNAVGPILTPTSAPTNLSLGYYFLSEPTTTGRYIEASWTNGAGQYNDLQVYKNNTWTTVPLSSAGPGVQMQIAFQEFGTWTYRVRNYNEDGSESFSATQQFYVGGGPEAFSYTVSALTSISATSHTQTRESATSNKIWIDFAPSAPWSSAKIYFWGDGWLSGITESNAGTWTITDLNQYDSTHEYATSISIGATTPKEISTKVETLQWATAKIQVTGAQGAQGYLVNWKLNGVQQTSYSYAGGENALIYVWSSTAPANSTIEIISVRAYDDAATENIGTSVVGTLSGSASTTVSPLSAMGPTVTNNYTYVVPAGKTPVLSNLVYITGGTPLATTSFRFDIDNYDSSYTWTVTSDNGTPGAITYVSSAATHRVTVTGTTAADVVVTVKTTRSGYADASATITGHTEKIINRNPTAYSDIYRRVDGTWSSYETGSTNAYIQWINTRIRNVNTQGTAKHTFYDSTVVSDFHNDIGGTGLTQTAYRFGIQAVGYGTYSINSIYSNGTTDEGAYNENDSDVNPQYPSKPTGLTATRFSNSRIDTTWNAASGATNYQLYWNTYDNTAGIDKSTLADFTGITTTSRSHTGLSGATQYWYWVRANNATGVSNWSASATATTDPNPVTTTTTTTTTTAAPTTTTTTAAPTTTTTTAAPTTTTTAAPSYSFAVSTPTATKSGSTINMSWSYTETSGNSFVYVETRLRRTSNNNQVTHLFFTKKTSDSYTNVAAGTFRMGVQACTQYPDGTIVYRPSSTGYIESASITV